MSQRSVRPHPEARRQSAAAWIAQRLRWERTLEALRAGKPAGKPLGKAA